MEGKATYTDAVAFIATCEDSGCLSNLNRMLISKIREIRNNAVQDARYAFNVGCRVSFVSRRRGGMIVTGTVLKINRTTATVVEDKTDPKRMFTPTWRVHMSLLKRVL